MNKNNLDNADMTLLHFLDKYFIHMLYWAIIALVVELMS